MLHRAFETTAELVAQLVLFALAFTLSTGFACSPRKFSCDQPRDEAAEVRTP